MGTGILRTIDRWEYRSTVDHSQYWQGMGIAFTDFDAVSTGVWDLETLAFSDALDDLAERGWDTTSIWAPNDLSEESAHAGCEHDDDCPCVETLESDCGCGQEAGECDCHRECELHWFVSIFVAGEDR